VASAARPDTILAWFRKLVAQKFDGSRHRLYPGRPPIGPEITELIVRMARENSGWGYDRIAGALDRLGHRVSDQTVGNILRCYGIAPAPKRCQQMSWADFIRSHMTGPDRHRFLHCGGAHLARLATYYVLFFLHLETRRVTLAGITQHPTEEWMVQMARRAVDAIDGTLLPIRFVLHDRDKILRFLSKHPSVGRHSTSQTAGPQSESECVRRALGTLDQKRVSIEADSLR
jgi:hypothetical protein